mgnify:CR=1 FL=1
MASDAAKRAAIEARIPHRDPFLLLDELVDEGPNWIVTRWTPPRTLPAFAGHYPGQPILPGVLISEMCFQSAALLLAGPADARAAGAGIPVLTRIHDARFKRMVKPGETLEARVEELERLQNARFLRATVRVDGQLALRISFAVAEAPADDAAASATSASRPNPAQGRLPHERLGS